ncbi:MAG: hypothetical protein U1E73_02105 [Planctomycetota bacterium]
MRFHNQTTRSAANPRITLGSKPIVFGGLSTGAVNPVERLVSGQVGVRSQVCVRRQVGPSWQAEVESKNRRLIRTVELVGSCVLMGLFLVVALFG